MKETLDCEKCGDRAEVTGFVVMHPVHQVFFEKVQPTEHVKSGALKTFRCGCGHTGIRIYLSLEEETLVGAFNAFDGPPPVPGVKKNKAIKVGVIS